GDVLSIHRLAELCSDALEHLGPVVSGELGGGGARLDQRDTHVALAEFLAQGLAEGADTVLGEGVDATAVARHPASPRAYGPHVGHLAGAFGCAPEKVR